MDDKRAMLRHFLAAIAYRTQKALRDAPAGFTDFRAIPGVRTPHELISHMTGVLGYARTHFEGGIWRHELAEDFESEVDRFHGILESLKGHLEKESPFLDTTPERMLQGPFADAMTHAGQIAMLRRFYGSPVRPENFIKAHIDAGNVGADQADPVSPDAKWFDAEGNEQD